MAMLIQASNSTGGTLLQDLSGILNSPFIIFLLGSLVSIGTTGLYNWQRRNIKQKRLRRAILVELSIIDAPALHRMVREFRQNKPLREILKEEYEKIPRLEELSGESGEEQFQSLVQKAASQSLGSISGTNLRSEVYEENVSQIGMLTYEQAAAVIRFYKQLDKVRNQFETVQSYADEGDQSKFESSLFTLSNNLEHLSELDERLHDELDSDDFDIEHGASTETQEATAPESTERPDSDESNAQNADDE